MDTTVTIIGLAILLLIFVPIMMVHNKQNKKTNATLSKLREAATAQNSDLDSSDTWNASSAIGIAGKSLYFLENENADVHTYDLNKVKECKIINSGRSVQHVADQLHSIRRLELALITPHYEEEQRLLFFDAKTNLQVSDELVLIKKWHEIISSRLQA